MAGTHTDTVALTYSLACTSAICLHSMAHGAQESLRARFALRSTRRTRRENNTHSVFLAIPLSLSVCVSASVFVSVKWVSVCAGVYLVCMNAVEGLYVNDLKECVGERGRMSACQI